MGRKSKPPRLWARKQEDTWLILDRGKQYRTGCALADTEGAEKALQQYLAEKEAFTPRDQPPETVGHVLACYLEDHSSDVRDPERLFNCANTLQDFWAERHPSEVDRERCREYANQHRKSMSAATVRRELSMLNTALNFCVANKGLRATFKVRLPKKPAPRDRAFDRGELARLLRASSPHLRRFILISYYTWRRHRSVLALSWERSREGGWIDLRNERIHFLPEGQEESKKRRGSVPIPKPLLFHVKRWYRLDRGAQDQHVIRFRGRPVRNIRKAMDAAVARAGLSSAVPHALKHSAVTMYFEKGGNLSDGAEFFATSEETLLRIYKKHSPTFARRGAEVIGRKP